MGKSIILTLLEILNQAKVFHWQTVSYAEHKAFGDYYNTMSGLVDRFVESYQGIYGRDFFEDSDFTSTISLIDYNIEGDNYCNQVLANLDELEFADFGLKAIVDEMIAETNKLKYLLTLG